MNKSFMKFMNLNYSWILKQRFLTFGTVIYVADNEQDDDVEMDYEQIYSCIYVFMTYYIYILSFFLWFGRPKSITGLSEW